jgi:mycoredoxin
MDAPLLVYTTTSCGDCVATKRRSTPAGSPTCEVALEGDPAAVAHVEAVNGGRRSVPTLVRGTVAASLSRFSPAKLDAFLDAAGLA